MCSRAVRNAVARLSPALGWFSKRARPPVDGIDPLKDLSSTRPILRTARTGGSAHFGRDAFENHPSAGAVH
jgi:hypothetical protein